MVTSTELLPSLNTSRSPSLSYQASEEDGKSVPSLSKSIAAVASPLLLAIGRLEGSMPGSRLEEREALTNPRQALLTLHERVATLTRELQVRMEAAERDPANYPLPANGETPLLQQTR